MTREVLNRLIQNKNVVMFVTALFFMSGILAYFNSNVILWAAIYSILAIVFIVKNYLPSKYILLWVLIFYIGFFNAYFRINTTDDLVPYANNKVELSGQIISIPSSNDNLKLKFFFNVDEVNGESIKGKTLVTVTADNANFSQFQIGDFYTMSGYLKTPFKAGNPSQFDYGKYLRNFDTFTVFYATETVADSKILNLKWKFLQKLNLLRNRIIDVHSNNLKSPNLELLGGIVFGDDAVATPEDVKNSFVNSGLLHILAASGMNVAFIYGFWVFFMRRFKAPFKITVISGMFLIILYTFMTGLGASVIRAALMLLFILAGKLIDRDAHSISLLAFVALLMLVYNPAFINDVGFQLSFIVTFGILTTADLFMMKSSKLPTWLSAAIFIPVVAQIWVAPIQMFYFNSFSTYSIFANILSIPFLSVISFGGFVSSILAILTPLTDKICLCIDFVLNYMLSIIVSISNFFAHLPNSLLSTVHPKFIQIILYYSLILFVIYFIKTSFNKKRILFCITILSIILMLFIRIPTRDLQIITFDVQNADCFLLKTPSNKYFIIDTGRAGFKGSKAQANSIIIKYLKDRGIKNIEGLIITHFDNDHSGGAVDIIKNLTVKKVYLNSFNDKTMTSVNIYKTLQEKQTPTLIPANNQLIYNENNLTIKTFMSDIEKDNEKSIITLLSYKDFDMLFMGDAGVEAFESLESYIPTDIEVLKVGHHGGSNVVNTKMLEKLNVKTSIISTGPNAFGHPNKGTLDILRNTDIYRTDRHNSIKITSDGCAYKTYLYNPSKNRYELANSGKFIFKSGFNFINN